MNKRINQINDPYITKFSQFRTSKDYAHMRTQQQSLANISRNKNVGILNRYVPKRPPSMTMRPNDLTTHKYKKNENVLSKFDKRPPRRIKKMAQTIRGISNARYSSAIDALQIRIE